MLEINRTLLVISLATTLYVGFKLGRKYEAVRRDLFECV
jgi:hypothetical protein